MDVADIDGKHGVLFPVKEVSKMAGSAFPVQAYDWPDVEKRINPLVQLVLDKVLVKKVAETKPF